VKKEKYDAAIDRFKEAADLVPTYALPNKLMGEAYEKKHFLPEALQAYEKYLQIAPKAGDAEEVRKRVARLHTEMQDDDRRRAAAAKP
jgi:tetratricopeptide (TPR) repeat protein